MHASAWKFCEYAINALRSFMTGIIIEVGSVDINGSVRKLVPEASSYIGYDVAPGKGVDIVGTFHEQDIPDESVDVVLTTEALEHDMHWRLTVRKCLDVLKPGGIYIMTCASTGRREHGTRRTSARDSLTAALPDSEWPDYYGNRVADDIRGLLREDEVMYQAFYYHSGSKDLYCILQKSHSDTSKRVSIPGYTSGGVSVA